MCRKNTKTACFLSLSLAGLMGILGLPETVCPSIHLSVCLHKLLQIFLKFGWNALYLRKLLQVWSWKSSSLNIDIREQKVLLTFFWHSCSHFWRQISDMWGYIPTPVVFLMNFKISLYKTCGPVVIGFICTIMDGILFLLFFFKFTGT